MEKKNDNKHCIKTSEKRLIHVFRGMIEILLPEVSGKWAKRIPSNQNGVWVWISLRVYKILLFPILTVPVVNRKTRVSEKKKRTPSNQNGVWVWFSLGVYQILLFPILTVPVVNRKTRVSEEKKGTIKIKKRIDKNMELELREQYEKQQSKTKKKKNENKTQDTGNLRKNWERHDHSTNMIR